MKLTLANRLNSVKVFIILTALSVLIGAGVAFLGQLGVLILPVLTACLAVMMIFAEGKKHLFAICASVALVILELVFNSIYSFTCLTALILALVIALAVKRGWQKSELAATLTVILSLVFVAYAFLSAFYELKSFDVEAARELLANMFTQVREEMHKLLTTYTVPGADGNNSHLFTEENIAAILDLYMSVLISVVVITAFALVGITLKLFSAIAVRITEDNTELLGWRFRTSAVFAVFYLILSIVAVFVTGSSTAATVILNLYVLYTAVYAYLGFGALRVWLSRRFGNSPFVTVLVIFAIICFISYAMTLLALFGAFAMIPRRARVSHDNNDDGQGG